MNFAQMMDAEPPHTEVQYGELDFGSSKLSRRRSAAEDFFNIGL